jgi:hypothetical protein
MKGLAALLTRLKYDLPAREALEVPETLAARVAWLAQAAADAFEAFQAPDPELDHERSVMAEARLAEESMIDRPCRR